MLKVSCKTGRRLAGDSQALRLISLSNILVIKLPISTQKGASKKLTAF